jgi:AcrR family transcriptional regulator
MTSSTKNRLAVAAAQLLDRGGQEAVTLRAVAEKVGVSHNAPYKHFRDRNALLAGVARRDFEELNCVFADALNDGPDGASALRRALKAFVDYGLAHPSRYRLLFSDPDLQADDDFKGAATGPLKIIVQIVLRCQSGGVLPTGDPVRLSGLIFAAAHGPSTLRSVAGPATKKASEVSWER